MARAASPEDLGRLLDSLFERTALFELAVVAACLALAWVIVRGARGAAPRPGSIWFGEGVVDGVLFPCWRCCWRCWRAGCCRSGCRSPSSARGAGVAVAGRHPAHGARAAPGVPGVAAHAQCRAQRVVAGLAGPRAVDHRRAAGHPAGTRRGRLDRFGTTSISLRNLLEGMFTAVVVMVGALWVSAALEQKLLAGTTDNLSTRKMAANALRALLLFVALMFALSAAGIDLTALGVLGGAIGVGIGFGLQKLASNYISGFVILAERSMRIGDTVKVDNFEGRITDINTRYTVIRALNGRESIVPNEMLITQRVENSSLPTPTCCSAPWCRWPTAPTSTC
jgi:hypothetical protein